MKVLVTGVTGFLGSHLVDACLARGESVRALVRPSSEHLLHTAQVDMCLGDIESEASVTQATRDIDVVYHAAARVSDFGSRADFVRTNVTATQQLLEAAKRNRVKKFVYISSPSVVMTDQDQLDIDESAPYAARPLNLYCETKAEAERHVLAVHGHGLWTCSIRPRAVWGPRDKTGWFPRLLLKMQQGRLPNLSGGRPVWSSLCYCTDAAQACLLAADSERAGGKAYFITDGQSTEVWAFAEAVAQRFGIAAPQRRVNPQVAMALASIIERGWHLVGLDRHRSPPISRYGLCLVARSGTFRCDAARRDLGYQPRVTAAQGLDQLWAWVQSQGGLDSFLKHVKGAA